MNVREDQLREKIDPYLSEQRLGLVARIAFAESEPQVESVKVLSGGCWNRVVGVSFASGEPDLVCKISPEDRDEKIIREYRVLGYFASHTSLPVPEPLFIDASGELIPGTLLVMTKIPGVVLHRVHGLLSPEMIDALTDQIAAQVIELHRERGRGFGGAELEENERSKAWADFWLPRFDRVFTEISAANLVSGALLSRVERVRRSFGRALDIGLRSTLTHYDIWSGNVMVGFAGSGYPGNPYVSGYIDIPGFWADYARELSFMEMFGVANRRFYERYWRAYPRDAEFELRKNIYNLKMHLKHITMYPSERYYRQGAEQALGFIESCL